MHIFVINLEKDAARRESISAQLDALGLAYQIVSGVYGASLTEQERARVYDDRKAKLHRARSLVPAEIGCALSHLKVYRAIVERRLDAALILEDDVALPANLPQVLDECSSHLKASTPSVWLLSPADGDTAASNLFPIGASHRVLPYQSGYFASSYLLTRAAAAALLRELEPVSDVADCWQRLARYKVVDLYVVAPPLIEQKQDEFGSSTTADYHAKTRTGLIARVLYKARRARSILWDCVYGPYRRRFRPYAGLKFDLQE
jgi:glycosyl transferase family 25